MNVVGKVGSLISQGVYTVATPFHPFGGAVDVIVVQQQDGTFRSTPWYVRFGKFQGVLKGAEKIVSIEVNGVEASFHMYLNACGEAYFVKDAGPDRVSQRKGALSSSASHFIIRDENVCRLDHSFSEAGMAFRRNEYDRVPGQLERTETRFFDFQDDQVPVDLSRCDSNDPRSLVGEPIGETQGLDSEVVLVSVDGHMLTAPVEDSDQTIKDVQETTAQLHIKSSEAKVLVDGNEEVSSRENELPNGHETDSSTIDEALDKACSTSDYPHVSGQQLKAQVEHSLGSQEVQNLSREDGSHEHPAVTVASGNEQGDVCHVSRICLEVSELEAVKKSNNSEEADHTTDMGRSDEVGAYGLPEEEIGDSALKKGDGYEKSCDSGSRSGDGSASSQIEVESIDKEVLDAEEEEALDSETAAPVLGTAAFDLDSSVEPENAGPSEKSDLTDSKDESVTTSTSSSRRWSLWPIPFRRVKETERSTSTLSNGDAFVDSEPDMQSSEVESEEISRTRIDSPRKLFIRTNVPTNEQIESLNLKDGLNMVTFSFSTRMLGRQQVDAHIFLWKWDAKIVISDVDGTITKSDVLGQFMPLVGKDWTQTGVTHLFSAIRENGYQLLFLSARAIAQAYLTRNFLLNLKQDGKALPTGPVVISPDGLFPSLFREVIRRAPHEFKIACLEDIKKLFPPDHNPFYAGFGNRDTDELSYLKIGIPKGKIFIINPKGEVAISHHIGVRSYTSLHTLVNDMFPPACVVEQEDYNMWNFWKMPLPDVIR